MHLLGTIFATPIWHTRDRAPQLDSNVSHAHIAHPARFAMSLSGLTLGEYVVVACVRVCLRVCALARLRGSVMAKAHGTIRW